MAPGWIEEFRLTPAHHKYSFGHIILFVSLVLSAAASFRCASRSLEAVISSLQPGLRSPSWFCGRLWILRLGYYKLTRAKEKAEDWVWIVDHTVQVGAEKCLVILGLRLCHLPEDRSLRHEDVEPIALLPVKQSNGEIVYQQLEEAIEKTGVPREIIADHGSDVKSGIDKFCQKHPQTSSVYDIKHKAAILLKDELQEDKDWLEFSQLAAQTKRKVQQTSLASLAPPNQRTKSRYMNIDTLVRWGCQVLTFLDRQKVEPAKEFDHKQIEEKLGWIFRFRDQLKEWEELLQVVTIAESMVRKQGLSHSLAHELKKLLTPVAHTERVKRIRDQLLAFVAEQSLKAKPDERLLGSSEVIESVFGKLKRLEQDQARSGFTALILSVGAMVSSTTKEVIQQALQTVPTKQILIWCKEKLGQSVQAKRKKALALPEKKEQKPDQSRKVA